LSHPCVRLDVDREGFFVVTPRCVTCRVAPEQFAQRTRTIELGHAKKMIHFRNMEEMLGKAKHDLEVSSRGVGIGLGAPPVVWALVWGA
jgi:hypothetical protein